MTVWRDVIGQDAAVSTLSRAVFDPGSMTHAWLLTGPPGSGRSVAARAFAAVTNEDLANLESALTACSLNRDLRIVLRAGDGDVSEDTQSLGRIGHVVDVHRLGAAYIAGVALGSEADGVALRDGRAELLLPSGERETAPLVVAR